MNKLASMPGITSTNHMSIVNKIETLKDLFEFTLEEIQQLIGTKNGLKLYKFLSDSINCPSKKNSKTRK